MRLRELLYEKRWWVILFILFLFICYFPIFWHLGSQPIQMWDEGIFATNALEMSLNGNLIVKYYNDKPDMWNLKPPLMTWVQALMMKLFGYGEVPFRLPSAICALLTVLLLLRFCMTELKSRLTGYLSGLVLITSWGYIHHHVARTGDHDVALTMFLTASALYYYRFLEHGQRKHLWIAAIALVLGALTKSIAALFFIPGLIAYTGFRKKFGVLFRSRGFYLSIVVFLGIITGYYLLREHYNPGYIKAVIDYEWMRRVTEPLEEHEHETLYYFNLLWSQYFVPWIFILPLSGLVFIKSMKEKKELRNFFFLALFCLAGFLLIISVAQTKTQWYLAPFFPLASILTAIGIQQALSKLDLILKLKTKLARNVMVILFVLALFELPYQRILDKVYWAKPKWWDQKYGGFMQRMKEESPQYKTYSVYYQGMNPHVLYYTQVFNKIHGFEITRKPHGEELFSGEIVVTCFFKKLRTIMDNYEYEEIDAVGECKLLRIIRPKYKK